MGIPSYYKKLVDTIPGLIRKVRPDITIDWLWMDFNCLIYHCLRSPLLPYYKLAHINGLEGKDEWERILTNVVVTYCLKIVKEVNPTKGVHICIDGVVPMAKMQQQRMRRFKSAWLAKHNNTVQSVDEILEEEDKSNGWEKNAITPGTEFMDKIKRRLELMIQQQIEKSDKQWFLSSSDESGEGEHKIMEQWRSGKYSGNYAIYGLDADLIVLSILNKTLIDSVGECWLFREEIASGTVTYNSLGEETFSWFSVKALMEYIVTGYDEVKARQFLLDYCFAMSVLGNDFLPSSLSYKISNDGNRELIEIIQKLTLPLVFQDTLEVCLEGLKELIGELAKEEEERICYTINKKISISYSLSRKEQTSIDAHDKTTVKSMRLGEHNWPLDNIHERCLMGSKKKLVSDWKERYLSMAFPSCKSSECVKKICKTYLYGMQWIWAYYTGQMHKVCFNWFYPHGIPPLWSNLVESFEELLPFPGEIVLKGSDIRPVEQLCLVLPLESWGLIPITAKKERKLPSVAPWLFPEEFGFDSVGKRYFWECEAQIPIPSIYEIKQLVN